MDQHAVTRWLEQFASAVRQRDLARGRALFAADVCSFGTRAGIAEGLDALVSEQWSRIWTATTGFAFIMPPVRFYAALDGSQAVVLVLWESKALDGTSRTGRCTLVLRRDDVSPTGLVAVHSHFSRTPPELTSGRF